jgi:hypothetical protein
MDMQLNEIDTSYINELLKKRNVCIYQLNAKIIRIDESVVLEKKLFVLLARPDNSYFIGFEHPMYNLAPTGFTKLLKTCLPILFDPENELMIKPEYQAKSFFSLSNNLFKFVDLEAKIHTIPVLKSLCTSFAFLKSLGYDIIHWLEYDEDIIDFSIFDNKKKKKRYGYSSNI